MKTLERNRIEDMVRDVESGAYRLALVLGFEPASAERVVLEAFASLAPSLARLGNPIELKEKLYARIRHRAAQRRGPVTADAPSDPTAAVSESLHTRIVDLLEEHQGDEPVGRRRAMLVGLIGVALAGALIAFVKIHADALAEAQPSITELSPLAAATDVSVSGDVRVKFGRRPAGTPTLRLEPAHAVLESVHWDGNTLVAVYSGLHLSTRYQLVLQADYRSRLNDAGHLNKRWTLTTQGYPVLSALTPAPDQPQAARVGKLSVDFSYRPPVEPRLTIMPADGTLLPGGWYGVTWNAGYNGLKPLTRYEVTLTVDYGAAAARTRRQWAFTTEPAWPAPGVAVIWYGSQPPWTASDQRLVAVDWQGRMAGSLYPTSIVLLQQGPDGSALLTKDGGYVDSHGVAAGDGPSISLIADDSRSICKLDSGQSWLMSGPLRGPMRRVAPVGPTGPRAGLDIIACSVTNDRAVILENGMTGTTSIRVIALSTGRLLYQRSYAGQSVGVISSRDGRYLAEQNSTVDAQGRFSASFTIIRRTLDGRIVARLDNRRVLRFSWDGTRVVTVGAFALDDVRLVDWQTGNVVWRSPGPDPGASASARGPAFALAQPNGTAMAIALGSLDRGGLADQLWIVAADGQAIQVAATEFYSPVISGF